MSTTVHVKGISSQTSEKEVRDFFSFCGKISSLSVTPQSDSSDASQTATVTFEKETAAKTALLLDNTQLGPAQVHVSAGQSLDQAAGGKTTSSADEPSDKDEISQEEKPRSRILAEYLAHGYAISDKAIERGIALDQQHGVSNRFMSTLQQFDAKYQASAKVQAADQKYGVSATAMQGWRGLSSYFDQASNTPTGQKVRAFYEQGSKQVLDVHNEAKHLAGLKKGTTEQVPGTDKTKCDCGADSGKCPCEPGKCACASCPKNADAKTTDVTPEQAEMEKVPGTEKTKCNCGGATGQCPCEPGKCACSGCGKA